MLSHFALSVLLFLIREYVQGQFGAADDVEMQMHHTLAGIGTAVGGGEALTLVCDLLCGIYCGKRVFDQICRRLLVDVSGRVSVRMSMGVALSRWKRSKTFFGHSRYCCCVSVILDLYHASK